MCKFTLLVFGLLVTVQSYSQLTLTSAINPSPGDMQIDVRADTTGITQGNSGANQTWNYPTLVRLDSNVNQWMTPASTGHGDLFPTSNIASLDTCYNFFDETPSRVDMVGYYSSNTAINYNNPEAVMTFPFGYNSVMTDSFTVLVNLNNQTILRRGYEVFTGDAWGIINLPFGTFLNALRLKEVITIKDTSYTYQSVLNTTYTIYEWYVPGKKFSVFKIMYTTISVLGYTFNYKNVIYNPNSVPIGIRPISTQVPDKYDLKQNYPNPFNPKTIIGFQVPRSGFVNLKLFDVQGREATTLVNDDLVPGKYEIEFDASNYASGIYFYKLQAETYSETKKMVLIK